ncbi:hypothetical protein FB451DRAFT_1191655 [Mycena latifolia]|nr:hypothetical protein FB451DRAFT_1191655 [Mycena latifolia]
MSDPALDTHYSSAANSSPKRADFAVQRSWERIALLPLPPESHPSTFDVLFCAVPIRASDAIVFSFALGAQLWLGCLAVGSSLPGAACIVGCDLSLCQLRVPRKFIVGRTEREGTRQGQMKEPTCLVHSAAELRTSIWPYEMSFFRALGRNTRLSVGPAGVRQERTIMQERDNIIQMFKLSVRRRIYLSPAWRWRERIEFRSVILSSRLEHVGCPEGYLALPALKFERFSRVQMLRYDSPIKVLCRSSLDALRWAEVGRRAGQEILSASLLPVDLAKSHGQLLPSQERKIS